MSKEFTDVIFNPVEFKKELDLFRALLDSKKMLSEKEIQPLFKKSPHLTAYIGSAIGLKMGVAKQVAYEFELIGDFAADIVFGIRVKHFCFVELEDGDPASVLAKVGTKSTKEWGRRLEHGFSQIVDWFCCMDGISTTPKFQKHFGYGHIDFSGLLLIGRDDGLDDDDLRRLRWRKHNVIVDSHPVMCMTYDELYRDLNELYSLFAEAFKVDSKPTALPVQASDAKK